MRAFLAIAMPPPVSERLAECARMLRPRIPGARWTDPAALHLTLRFLGERSPGDHTACGTRAAEGLARISRPPIALGTLGVFPERGPARVLWAALDDAGGGLRSAAEICEDAARATGYPPEERPFRAHVTLARLSGGPSPHGGARGVRPLLDDASARLVAAPLPPLEAPETILFESRLTRGGPAYTPLARYPFGAAGAAAC